MDSFSFLQHPVHQRSLEILQRCKEEKYSKAAHPPKPCVVPSTWKWKSRAFLRVACRLHGQHDFHSPFLRLECFLLKLVIYLFFNVGDCPVGYGHHIVNYLDCYHWIGFYFLSLKYQIHITKMNSTFFLFALWKFYWNVIKVKLKRTIW